MKKLIATLANLATFGAVFVKGSGEEEDMEAFFAKMDECKTEVGATDADMEELFGMESASTMEGKCLRHCIMKQYELMDDSGKFGKEAALAHAQKYAGDSDHKMEIATEMINKCSEIEVSDDHCEAAEQYGICFHDEAAARDFDRDFVF